MIKCYDSKNSKSFVTNNCALHLHVTIAIFFFFVVDSFVISSCIKINKDTKNITVWVV